MIHNKYRIQILELILILAFVSGCVSTTNVDAPSQVNTDSSFQALVTVEIDEGGGEAIGELGVLVPNEWNADNVTYTGPNSGSMFYNEDLALEFESYFPSASSDHWIGFDTGSLISGMVGDCYEVTVTVHTDDIIRTVDIAFLAKVCLWFNGSPCSTTVEVVQLNLEQSTWGAVKSEFGSQ